MVWFTIESNGKVIWFVGDTAMGPVFEQELAKRIAPVDITLTPVGAFLPREILPSHTTPESNISRQNDGVQISNWNALGNFPAWARIIRLTPLNDLTKRRHRM